MRARGAAPRRYGAQVTACVSGSKPTTAHVGGVAGARPQRSEQGSAAKPEAHASTSASVAAMMLAARDVVQDETDSARICSQSDAVTALCPRDALHPTRVAHAASTKCSHAETTRGSIPASGEPPSEHPSRDTTAAGGAATQTGTLAV